MHIPQFEFRAPRRSAWFQGSLLQLVKARGKSSFVTQDTAAVPSKISEFVLRDVWNQNWTALRAGSRYRRKSGHGSPCTCTEDNCLQQGIARESIRAVNSRAGGLTCGEKPRQIC